MPQNGSKMVHELQTYAKSPHEGGTNVALCRPKVGKHGSKMVNVCLRWATIASRLLQMISNVIRAASRRVPDGAGWLDAGPTWPKIPFSDGSKVIHFSGSKVIHGYNH